MASFWGWKAKDNVYFDFLLEISNIKFFSMEKKKLLPRNDKLTSSLYMDQNVTKIDRIT
jgi:hypothetical protein